jgi:transcription antitermination factor NusG
VKKIAEEDHGIFETPDNGADNMDRRWHVMRTIPGKEAEMTDLLERKVNHELWRDCRILRKQQLFRTQGRYLLGRKNMFPGYIFINTEFPKELEKELRKARQFPKLLGSAAGDIVPVEEEDLRFLEDVCGRDLAHDMRLSTVRVDEEGQVRSASGALKPYVGRITRQRLRHRYVTAEVPLFNRRENVLFGIRVDGDPV